MFDNTKTPCLMAFLAFDSLYHFGALIFTLTFCQGSFFLTILLRWFFYLNKMLRWLFTFAFCKGKLEQLPLQNVKVIFTVPFWYGSFFLTILVRQLFIVAYYTNSKPVFVQVYKKSFFCTTMPLLIDKNQLAW